MEEKLQDSQIYPYRFVKQMGVDRDSEKVRHGNSTAFRLDGPNMDNGNRTGLHVDMSRTFHYSTFRERQKQLDQRWAPEEYRGYRMYLAARG